MRPSHYKLAAPYHPPLSPYSCRSESKEQSKKKAKKDKKDEKKDKVGEYTL